MKNKFECFTPLMHEHEYKFIEKYLTESDTLLEWGCGNSTLYFSGLVKKIITIEHDKDWLKIIEDTINAYEIKNIESHLIPAHLPEPIPCRYEQFKDYVEYVKINKLEFSKVLIDGRARKYCAKSIYDYIDENVIVFIHDFNRPDYQMTLKYYDLIEFNKKGQGIAALKKKKEVKHNPSEYY